MLREIRQETVVKPGGVIELASDDFPVGTSVQVIVLLNEDSSQLSTALDEDEKWARFYKNVVGAWKDDEEISQIFEEIDRERHLDYGRETPSFDQ